MSCIKLLFFNKGSLCFLFMWISYVYCQLTCFFRIVITQHRHIGAEFENQNFICNVVLLQKPIPHRNIYAQPFNKSSSFFWILRKCELCCTLTYTRTSSPLLVSVISSSKNGNGICWCQPTHPAPQPKKHRKKKQTKENEE